MAPLELFDGGRRELLARAHFATLDREVRERTAYALLSTLSAFSTLRALAAAARLGEASGSGCGNLARNPLDGTLLGALSDADVEDGLESQRMLLGLTRNELGDL